jgi:hypothetical protein
MARITTTDTAALTGQPQATEPVKVERELFVSEGTRHDLASGLRAYDPATGRELELTEAGVIQFKD